MRVQNLLARWGLLGCSAILPQTSAAGFQGTGNADQDDKTKEKLWGYSMRALSQQPWHWAAEFTRKGGSIRLCQKLCAVRLRTGWRESRTCEHFLWGICRTKDTCQRHPSSCDWRLVRAESCTDGKVKEGVRKVSTSCASWTTGVFFCSPLAMIAAQTGVVELRVLWKSILKILLQVGPTESSAQRTLNFRQRVCESSDGVRGR